ncbi:MAG: DUF2490 domain-containing protein [Chlamydiia bacterium]|nr:DUF2490 domain-containing protein [Chlamydiia bacterium]
MKTLLFLLALVVPLFGRINDNGDTGLWLEESFQHEFIEFNFQQRWTDNFNLFYYQRYEGIVSYRPVPPWEFGLGYAFNISLLEEKWVTGQDYFAQATLKLPLWDGNLEQRARITYIVPNFKEHKRHATERYRVRYFSPWFLTRCCVNPWISNEFFFRKDTRNEPRGQVGGLFENRFRVGFRANFLKKVSYDLYFQWLGLKRRDRWDFVYDLGLTTFVNF